MTKGNQQSMTIYGTLSLSLASKCQVSVERIVLDLEPEGLGSIPTRGNIFFYVL